jgi:uncharacterized protein DUF1587
MRLLALVAVLAGAWMASGARLPDDFATPSARVPSLVLGPAPAAAHATPPSLAPATLTDVVRQYCVVCHNDQMLTGNVSLQSFEVERAAEHAQTAERMIRKLRAGMMPPPGSPRPGADTIQQLIETLEQTVDRAAASAPNLGTRRFQRISRAEYQRVIRDMLALEVDPSKWLPADVLVGAFDNASAGQALSTTLVDAYMRAASEVSWLAIGNPDAVSVTAKYRNKSEVSQHAWDRLEGAPFGTRGGIVVTHDFPADGEYVFQIETEYGEGTQIFHDVDITVADEPVAQIMLEHQAGTTNPKRTEPVFIRAGQHRVSAAFIERIEGPYEDR